MKDNFWKIHRKGENLLQFCYLKCFKIFDPFLYARTILKSTRRILVPFSLIDWLNTGKYFNI